MSGKSQKQKLTLGHLRRNDARPFMSAFGGNLRLRASNVVPLISVMQTSQKPNRLQDQISAAGTYRSLQRVLAQVRTSLSRAWMSTNVQS